MKKKKSWLGNLIFALAILIVAGGWWFWQSRRTAQPSGTLVAQLTYGDDNQVMTIPLDEDASYDVDTGYYTVHLQVEDGRVRFYDSPCPDHICENYGWISLEDQQAVCMPARAVLMIVPAG